MKSGLILTCLFALFLGGCASTEVRTAPDADLHRYRHVFVLRLLTDGRGVDGFIAQELRARGYDASSGFSTQMPTDTDLVVSYQDEWTSEFEGYYLIGLSLRAADVRNDRAVGIVNTYRPSMAFGGNPRALIHELVDKLFGPAAR